MGSNWLREVGELPGLTVWRIDNKSNEISIVTKGSHGVFRSDDSYILLVTSVGEDGTTKSHKIHTWFGQTTKREEDCVARAEELAARLGTSPTISRHIHGAESDEFKSLFTYRGGCTYIEPLVLKKQQNLREDVHVRKLYIIKGKKYPRVKRIEIDVANLNHGDIFLLDDDVKIFSWLGAKSNRLERGKALDTTTRLRDERMNRIKAEVVQIQDGRETEEFWKLLGTKGSDNPQDKIKSDAEGGDDEAFENAALTEDILYKVYEDAEGQVKVDEVERSAPLHRDMLESNCSYVVDCQTEIFVWTGRDSSQNAKTEAGIFAEALKSDAGRPSWVEITTMAQSVETSLFKMKFRGVFKEYMDTPEQFKDRLTKFHKIANVRQEKVNVDQLHHPEKYAFAKEDDYALMEKLIPSKPETDDDPENTKMWYIVGKKLVELPAEEYDVVYFWLGRSASIDDKGSAAMQAADYSKQFGRSVYQVRVVQNKEPDHFLSHFVHKFIVRRGKRETWGENIQKRAALYQVRGADKLHCRAIEMEAVAFALSSSDVYIATNPIEKRVFIWSGAKSNDAEREYAHAFVKNHVALSAASASEYRVEVCKEDEEPKMFWDTLGGKAEYARNFDLERKRRMFFCSDRTSVFKVTEVEDFIQDDLQDRGVMMLDGFIEVFLWVGSKATQREKDMAMQTAEDYIREADDGRPKECCLYRVNANEEPNQFYVYFQGWDHPPMPATTPGSIPTIVAPSPLPEAHKVHDKPTSPTTSPRVSQPVAKPHVVSASSLSPSSGRSRMPSMAIPVAKAQPTSDSLPLISPRRTESKALLITSPRGITPGTPSDFNSPAADAEKNPLNPEGVTWDFDRLRIKPLPPGVEPTKLESYLSLDQFVKFLKMTPEAFYKLPKWKQLVVKKDAQLF